MFITDKEVQRIVSNNRTMYLSKQYYLQDAVSEIYIIYDERLHLHKIKATVDINGFHAFCVIEVDNDSKITNYHCNCFSCNEYNACGHVGAALMKVQELSPDTFPFHYKNDREAKKREQMRVFEEQRKQRQQEFLQRRIEEREKTTKELIEQYKQRIEMDFSNAVDPIKYKIFASLEDNGDTLVLKYKVGLTNKYVIKDLIQFIKSIKDEKLVTYGAKLSFIHDENHFDDFSLKQIGFISECFLLQKNQLSNYARYNNKDITVTRDIIDDVYMLYKDAPRGYLDFKVCDIEYMPTIMIEDREGHYRITLEDVTEYILGLRHMYRYRNFTLQRVILDKQGKTVKLLEELYLNEEIIVKKEDGEEFYKYVLSDMKDFLVIKGVDLSTLVFQEESIALYGDIDEHGEIYLKLECVYQDKQVRSGFDNKNKDTSITVDKIISYIMKFSSHKDDKKHIVYLDVNKDTTYEFIQSGLPFLAKYCDIFVSEDLQKLGTKSKFSMQVGVSVKNNLLAIDVDSVDIPRDELANVLQSYKRKKKFHKLKDGKLLYLESNELEELDKIMDAYDVSIQDMHDGHFDMDMYRMFSVEKDALDSEYLSFHREESFKELIEKFKQVSKKDFAIPVHYQPVLREYQKYGYKWLQTMSEYGFGGILADDMGLGKTVQMIALLEANQREEGISIVVCPSSLVLNWQDEIHKFSKTLKCSSIYGSLSKRKEIIRQYQEYDVLITSYDYVRRDIALYENIIFDYIVLDEAQYIKNLKTKNAITVKKLQGKHRFALTGTPIENSLAELWSIFDFLMKGYLYNYHHFQTQYESPIVKEKDEEKQKELKRLIEPFVLRRTKKEVLVELPDKIENTMTIDFNEEERKLYLANLMQVNNQLQEQLQSDSMDRMQVLAMLTRLRQICCEPRVVFDNIQHPSSKLEGCMELIRNLKENNQKVLLFSSFTSVLDLIAKELEQEGISYYILTGKTNKDKRRELVNAFQKDKTTVFLISLKAGGTGLNLTAAEAVIHFDPWWNMSAQNQATDRAHRIGQKNTVQVFKLIMKDSVEEKIMELQNKKKNLADTFVENNEGSVTSMSTKDIVDLFKM